MHKIIITAFLFLGLSIQAQANSSFNYLKSECRSIGGHIQHLEKMNKHKVACFSKLISANLYMLMLYNTIDNNKESQDILAKVIVLLYDTEHLNCNKEDLVHCTKYQALRLYTYIGKHLEI